MIQQKKSADVDSDVQSKQFLMLMQWMEIAGYEHYEISNYAVPGNRSRHNSSYWQGKKYLGIGPSAHSFDGQSRQWNISNNNLYIQSVKNKLIPYEKEILTSKQLLNEYIMTALRTKEGIHSDILTSRFEISINEFFEKATKYIQNSLMLVEGNSYKLTNEGKLLADGIAADLFY
jgi:oxygen-independent coproporphyrinogen-3 oxidase